MSHIGSTQLTSVYSKITKKPINPSRKEKQKSLQFCHHHETKLGEYLKLELKIELINIIK